MTEFEKLFNDNRELIFKYLMKMTQDTSLSDELTQETFFRAYMNYASLKNKEKASVWLCQIAKNAYLTEQKKRSRQTALEIAFELADGAHFTDRLCEKEQVMQIHRTLHALKECS